MKLKPLTSADSLFVVASMTRPAQAATGRDLALIHRNQGYSRIAVHFVIERDGALFEGRPLNLPGALAGKRNTSAYQVCLLGGVNDAMEPEANFTAEQLTTLTELEQRLGLPVVFAPHFPQ